MSLEIRTDSERLALAISRSGLRRIEVAMKAGLSPSRLSLILNGHYAASKKERGALARALNIPIRTLFKEPLPHRLGNRRDSSEKKEARS